MDWEVTRRLLHGAACSESPGPTLEGGHSHVGVGS